MPTRISPTGTISTGGSNQAFTANPISGQVGASNGNVGVGGNVQTGTIGANANIDGPGDTSFSVGAGFNPATGSVGVTPRVQFGEGRGSQVGANVGGAAGTAIGAAIGGPVGAAAGSFIGSGIGSAVGSAFNESVYAREHKKRDSVRNTLKDLGVYGSDYTLPLPDGSVANFSLEGDQGMSPWKNPSTVTDPEGGRNLFAFETDYTNDLDFFSGMAGMALSRLLNGGKNKAIDQVGQAIGNQALGRVGRGAEFSQENFNSVATNLLAIFGKGQIQTKEDLLSLANAAYGQGRLNDVDYVAVQQVGNMLFDKDYGTAVQLMAGRKKGAEAAMATPSNGQNRPGRIYSPVISPEEAMLSVQPFIDAYRKNMPKKVNYGAVQTAAQGLGVVSAIAGLLKNKGTPQQGGQQQAGGTIPGLIKDIKQFGTSLFDNIQELTGLGVDDIPTDSIDLQPDPSLFGTPAPEPTLPDVEYGDYSLDF